MLFLSITTFFESASGMALSVGVVVLLIVAFALFLKRKSRLSVKALTYSAISIALAMVLSNIKLFDMPQGGTVTACSMLFVSIIGYWFGLWPGLIAAATYGMLQLIIEPYVIHPVQLLMDYIFAFGALGLSGLFVNSKYGLYKGYVLGCLARCLFSTLSGIIFFAEYAGDMPVVLYSAGYNLSYIIPEMIITLIILRIPAFNAAIENIKNMAVKE